MMGLLRRIALMLLGRFGARLRYPHLFLIAAVFFGIDFILPDGLPFLDEIALGIAALLFGLWRNGRAGEPVPPPRNRPEPRAERVVQGERLD